MSKDVGHFMKCITLKTKFTFNNEAKKGLKMLSLVSCDKQKTALVRFSY
jgi:hypothetical protein